MPSASASCAVCGYDRMLTSHHIHPQDFKESYPEGAENINGRANMVLLCIGCHSAVHDKRPLEVLVKDLKTKLRRKVKNRHHEHEGAGREWQLPDRPQPRCLDHSRSLQPALRQQVTKTRTGQHCFILPGQYCRMSRYVSCLSQWVLNQCS